MDKLLAATAWYAANDVTDRTSTWLKILSKERLDIDRTPPGSGVLTDCRADRLHD